MRALIVLALMMGLLPSIATIAQEESANWDELSPATGHAQVIGHGVAAISDGDVAWRLSVRQAVAPDRATVAKRPAAFVLADDGAIAIADARGTIHTRLAPGEASWLEPDEPRAVVSLNGSRVEYYEIALASSPSAGDEAAATTEGFAAPSAGAVDVDLIRDVLERAEETEIPAAAAPMLLVVTGGKVFVESGNGEIAEIAAGKFLLVEGDIVVVGASRSPAAFVVARIGPPIVERVTLRDTSPKATPMPASLATPLATPAAAPMATPVARSQGPAAVGITAFTCPAAYDGSDFAKDCTEPAEGIAFSIEAHGEAVLSELADSDGKLLFSGVPPGDYTLLAAPGESAASHVRCRNAAGDNVSVERNLNEAALTLAPGDDITCDWYIVPGAGDEGRSSLTVSIRACPFGMTPQRFNRERCQPAPPGASLTLRDADSGAPLGVTQAPSAGWAWESVGAGSYDLDVNAFPEAFVDAALDTQPCCGEEHDFTIRMPQGFVDVERTLYLFPPEVPHDISLTILIRACPPGMTPETLLAESCEAAPAGTTLTLIEWEAPLGVAAAATDAWVWSELGPFTYELRVNAIPEGFVNYQLEGHSGHPCCPDQRDLAVVLGTGTPAFQRTLHLFRPPDAGDDEVDSDDDGLIDSREAELGANPFLADTDEDGLADGDEVDFYGTDPLQSDTDDDNLDDLDEVLTHSTNPLIGDTDGDSIADAREISAGSDPLNSASIPPTTTPSSTPTATPPLATPA